MFPVISDIHGNLEALEAVLADIACWHISAVYCLGDIVGYGPNPIECLEHALKWDVSVLGNHDQAVLFEPDGFGQSAERAILWTRHVLQTSGRNDLCSFLAGLPRSHHEDDFLFAHGSAHNPTHEYLFPEHIHDHPRMNRIAACFERYCFCGHTHLPGVFAPEPAGDWRCFSPEESNYFWRFDGRKTIVNVGSVGQPRDGDPRASYVIVDGWDVFFHRVEYDWQKTRDKIYAIPDLANFLGDRLGEGR